MAEIFFISGYMSNRVEAVIAMLAVTSVGAIWTGGLPTLGPSVWNSSMFFYVPIIMNYRKKF